jgi:hypothetical protein
MATSDTTAENRGADRRISDQPPLGDARTRYVRDHIGLLSTLVDAVPRGDTFRAAALPDPVYHRVTELSEHNIIVVERWTNDGPKGSTRAVWRVDRQARRGIRYWESRINTWPCGHAATGFRNPGGVEGYRCPRGFCKQTFSRETVIERFDG